MRKPSVSVIIPALNAEKTISSCIASVLDQDYPHDKYEIIAVDNGSTDRTMELLKGFDDRISIFCEPIIGSYNARNRGIRDADGDFLLFIDSDCHAEKDWISHMVRPFENRDIRIVSGKIRAASRKKIVQKYCDLFCHDQAAYFRINMAATSNMAVRRNDMLSAGMFNGKLLSGGDFELCRRVIRKSGELHYEKEAVVHHHYPGSILNLLKKCFTYGKWNVIINSKQGFRADAISYRRISRHGLDFLLIRFCQDMSFKAGLIAGRVSLKWNKFNQSRT